MKKKKNRFTIRQFFVPFSSSPTNPFSSVFMPLPIDIELYRAESSHTHTHCVLFLMMMNIILI
jgi:hypothetical protein